MTTLNKDICYSNILATVTKDKIPYRFTSETQQDPDAFIQEFNEYITLMGYNEPQAKILFKLAMEGDALDWVRTQRCDIGYPELVQNFRKRFLAADKTLKAIKALAALRIENGETPKHFLDRARLAAIQGGISDDILMAMILNAIPETSASQIMLARGTESLNWERFYQLCSNLQTNQLGVSLVVNAVSREQAHRRWCKFCSVKGHATDDCYSLERYVRERKKKVKGVRTIGAEEPTEETESQIKLIHSSFCIKSKIPLATVRLFGKELKALIDSGAEINMIKRKHVPLGTRIEKTTLGLVAANGSKIPIHGMIKNVETTIDDRSYKAHYLVSDSITKDCIIGSEFLIQNNITVHYGSSTRDKRCHRIVTGNTPPVAIKGYRHGPNLEVEIRSQVHKLLADALRDQQAVVLCGPCPKAKWEVEIVWTTGD
jgi:hypothetical protein